MLICDIGIEIQPIIMTENFIRVFKGPFSKEQNKTLIEEFDSIEGKADLKLNLDGTKIGSAAYIESSTDAERLLIDYVSQIVGDYIQELGVPYHFRSMMDEGYQIQRWDNSSSHWLSSTDESSPNRVLRVLIIMKASKGSSIKFRHHKAIPLLPGKVVVFPSLFTHSFILDPTDSGGLYITSTSVQTVPIDQEI